MKSFVATPCASTLVGGALLAASSVAIAQGAPPGLDVPTKGAFTCVEQSVSFVSALIERQGCALSVGTYTLTGDIDFAGVGTCTIDDVTIAVALGGQGNTFRGTHQVTSTPVPGEIDDVHFGNLTGDFFYSRLGEIMYADSFFRLCVPDPLIPAKCAGSPTDPSWENYDEHVIKDFYKEENGEKDGELVLDAGLEVITKNNWPRMKFRQTSTYLPPNGGIGRMTIEKVSIAPDNAPVCFITYTADVDDFGGGRQFIGSLDVFPLL